jgi:hypothetical protein
MPVAIATSTAIAVAYAITVPFGESGTANG